MTLQAIKYENGTLEVLDQLLLPKESKYIPILGVEDGWKVINKMQVGGPYSRRLGTLTPPPFPAYKDGLRRRPCGQTPCQQAHRF
ncbi:methylthioribose-1-phosphate isomerase isoform X2 [Aphis craccivora]|uniref:Methylthioribose-1-phosphate isomerase isoform X2 n=1 Tax=Aphis craccivora TaxID=307492 RepID=A0A6G0ZGZ5_APHCR|nr:methylthioribose-1-phosphate isomerase isoform X2 [Aphis craccivora]